MSNSTKLASGCALIVLVAAIAMVRPCLAQDVQPKEVAHEAAHAAEAHEAGGPNPLAFKTDLAIWTLVVFVILFAILKKFAWPQITEALEERERGIAAHIAAAEAKHEQAKQLLVDYDKRLQEAAGEVRALLEEARRDADHTKTRIVAEARQAAEQERDRAIREIERAKDGAIQDLAVTSANSAIDLARKILREQITPVQHDQLVKDALGKLAAATPSKN